jgi:capsular exopolysaccharide synthesis family protein
MTDHDTTVSPPAPSGGPGAAIRGADLASVLSLLRRRWLIIALCVVVTAGASLFLSLSEQKKYSAAASLLFRDPGIDQKLFGGSYFAPSGDPSRDAATNTSLVSLSEVSVLTARALGRNVNPVLIQSETHVLPQGQSDVVSVVVTDPDPRYAARIANTFAKQFIQFRRNADRATIQSAVGLVNKQLRQLTPRERSGAAGATLRSRGEQLKILSQLQTGNAELVQPAGVPGSPSSPTPKRDAIIAAFFGLLLGSLLAVVFERLDNRVRDPEEVEELFGRPLLASIPDRGTKLRRNSAAQQAEAFFMLRANLRYFNVKKDLRSVLVTSAGPAEGKTTVAWNLAGAASDAGGRVLLIETDLRKPTFGDRFTARSSAGLSNVLADSLDLDAVVQRVPTSGQGGAKRGRTIDVVTAGPLPPNPIDLLDSARMRELLRSAQDEYDLVVLDSAPMLVVSDTIPLLGLVDGVVVVSRMGKSTRNGARHLASRLENLEAPLLGIVANAVRFGTGGYGYGYGSYGYGAPDGADDDGDTGKPQAEPVASSESAAAEPANAAARTEHAAAADVNSPDPRAGDTHAPTEAEGPAAASRNGNGAGPEHDPVSVTAGQPETQPGPGPDRDTADPPAAEPPSLPANKVILGRRRFRWRGRG